MRKLKQTAVPVIAVCMIMALSSLLCIVCRGGGGSGIHRQMPSRMDFDYGTEYKAKVDVEINF